MAFVEYTGKRTGQPTLSIHEVGFVGIGSVLEVDDMTAARWTEEVDTGRVIDRDPDEKSKAAWVKEALEAGAVEPDKGTKVQICAWLDSNVPLREWAADFVAAGSPAVVEEEPAVPADAPPETLVEAVTAADGVDAEEGDQDG